MTYTSESSNNEYASSGVGTAGLSLGIIGTTLASGILGNGNGLSGLFGGNSSQQQQIAALMQENAIMKADATTNEKILAVYTELRSQDKAQDTKIAAIDQRLAAIETAAPLREQIVLGQVQSVATSLANSTASLQSEISSIQSTLSSIVTPVIKNSSVCPGWGNITITPASATTSST